MRRRPNTYLVLGVLAIAGCGDDTSLPAGQDTSGTVATETGTMPRDTAVDTTETGTSTGALTEDELCIAWCTTGNEAGCAPPFSGETCFTACKARLAGAQTLGCGTEVDAVLACESQSKRGGALCTALVCGTEYDAHDACTDTCNYVDISHGNSDKEPCVWEATCDDLPLLGYCSLSQDPLEMVCSCSSADAFGWCFVHPLDDASSYPEQCLAQEPAVARCCAEIFGGGEPG